MDLDAILDRAERDAARDRPNIVAIEVRGVEVTVGLGAGLSFVQIQPLEGGDGPCWISVGDEEDGGVTVFFQLAADHSPMRNRWMIPREVARAAVREFVRSGLRSVAVRWRDLRSGPGREHS
jgi:hypothetical protein